MPSSRLLVRQKSRRNRVDDTANASAGPVWFSKESFCQNGGVRCSPVCLIDEKRTDTDVNVVEVKDANGNEEMYIVSGCEWQRAWTLGKPDAVRSSNK